MLESTTSPSEHLLSVEASSDRMELNRGYVQIMRGDEWLQYSVTFVNSEIQKASGLETSNRGNDWRVLPME